MNRRRFLRGSAGAMLALPLLESLRPRRTWANDPVVVYTEWSQHV